MTKLRNGSAAVLFAMALAAGCSATSGTPFDPTLVGQSFFLCCTMRFNPAFEAADSNYARYVYDGGYVSGPVLRAGTRVKVVAVGSRGLAFQAEGSPTTYALTFAYGKNQMSPSQYFKNILRTTDPMSSLGEVPIAIETGINEGRLAAGMTKDQALLARGYPPAHQTPRLEGAEWIYYDTPGFVDRVVFSGDRIQTITRGPAP
jgi:hypothetical protein